MAKSYEEINEKITGMRDQLVAQSDELKHIAEAQIVDAEESRKAIASVSDTMKLLASEMTRMAEEVAKPSAPPTAATTTDPLAEPTKHATGSLPKLPDDSPDKPKVEPGAEPKA